MEMQCDAYAQPLYSHLKFILSQNGNSNENYILRLNDTYDEVLRDETINVHFLVFGSFFCITMEWSFESPIY